MTYNYLPTWAEFRESRAHHVPMDDACRDLTLCGSIGDAAVAKIESAVLRGQLPVEAAELIASAHGYTALAKRHLDRGDEAQAHELVTQAEALVVRANEVRMVAVQRRFAELKRRHLEEAAERSDTGKRALRAAAGKKRTGYADALKEAQRRRVARVEQQRQRDEEVHQAWSDLLSRVDLKNLGGI